MRCDTAWIMASYPPLMLTPSCRGASMEEAGRTASARHLDTKRRNPPPTAIGRRLPFFFLQARRVAPQRCGKIEGGVLPAASRLTKLVKAVSIYLETDMSQLHEYDSGEDQMGLRRSQQEKISLLFFTADSGSVRGVGTGPGGRAEGGLRVFGEHFLQNFCGGQPLRSEGLNSFAVLAVLCCRPRSPNIMVTLSL